MEKTFYQIIDEEYRRFMHPFLPVWHDGSDQKIYSPTACLKKAARAVAKRTGVSIAVATDYIRNRIF